MKKITIKAARVNAGLTQKEAAAHFGVSNKTLCAWEVGASMPNAKQIDMMCDLYGFSYDELNFLPPNML